jgi:uncharacterized protein YjaZ
VTKPKLELLPDRIRIIKSTQFSFRSDEQLENIRANFAITPEMTQKIERMKEKKSLDKLSKKQKNTSIQDNLLSDKDTKNLKQLDISKEELFEKTLKGLEIACNNSKKSNAFLSCNQQDLERELK